jgi:hypothetical protein
MTSAMGERLRQANLLLIDEMNTTCCYAVQDKVWVYDPAKSSWAEQPMLRRWRKTKRSTSSSIFGLVDPTVSLTEALNTFLLEEPVIECVCLYALVYTSDKPFFNISGNAHQFIVLYKPYQCCWLRHTNFCCTVFYVYGYFTR